MNRRIGISALAAGLVFTVAGFFAPIANASEPEGVAQLAWLAGCWSGEGGEECWLAPLGGTMLGMNRGPERDGREPAFEFLRIVEAEESVVLLASPSGRYPPTPFRATEIEEGRVVFANPEHDFPQRITYWLKPAQNGPELWARVEAQNEAGEWKGFEMNWTGASLAGR